MNIRDFAKICGCSYGTVTNVFLQPEKVKETTRKRILSLAEKYRYRPNRVAASLKNKTQMIGVLVYGGNSYFSTIGEGIQEYLLANGYCPLSLILNWSKRLEQIRFLIDRRVDGIIMVSPQTGLNPEEKAEVEQIKLPVVYVEPGPAEPLDWVDTDDRSGGKLMAEYLHSLGHRTVGIYPCKAEELEGSNAWERNIGFLQAAKELKMKCLPADQKTLRAKLEKNKDLSVFFCHTDVEAVKLMKLLTKLGYSVPEDIGVAGYADLDYAEKVTPSLTTIRQDGKQVGMRVAEIMINRLQNPESKIVHELIPVSLIKRESVIQHRKGKKK